MIKPKVDGWDFVDNILYNALSSCTCNNAGRSVILHVLRIRRTAIHYRICR